MGAPGMATLARAGRAAVLQAPSPATPRRGKPAPGQRARDAADGIRAGRASARRAEGVTPLGEQCLRDRGLARSPEQTRLTPREAGGELLGQTGRTYAGQRLRKPARKHGTAGLGKVRHMVQATKPATAAQLLAQLPPLLRGWAT
jgi:RNA-directed DNA polymerase